MYAASVLFTVLASVASISAAPVEPRKEAPAGWAYGYLEKYGTYHTRYLALDCQDKHDTSFFDDCCHPLLANESLDSRPSYCTPSTSSASAASQSEATATADSSDDDAAAQFAQATSTVASSSAAPSPTQSQDNSSNDDSSNNDNNDNNNNSGNNNGGGDVQTGGFATFFYQGGNPGACGNYHSDSDKIIAIDTAWYSNTGAVSPYCGRWITITNTNNGKTVTAEVQDACPTCANGNSLDLSVGAFTAIADESEGQVPISWTWA